MSTEPSTASGDTEPSAETREFENFFEQGALAYEEDPARVRQPPESEIFEAPLITAEQLARRARLRRVVAVLVSTLGVASLLLFAGRGLRPAADAEPVPVSMKPVATALSAARAQLLEPASTPAPPEKLEPREMATTAEASTPVPATPVPATPAAPVSKGATLLALPAPLPRRGGAAQAVVLPPASESSRQLPASPRAPPRAASAPPRVELAARPSRAAEPPPTATFPVDPQ